MLLRMFYIKSLAGQERKGTKRKAEEPHKTSIQKQINYSDGIGNRIN